VWREIWARLNKKIQVGVGRGVMGSTTNKLTDKQQRFARIYAGNGGNGSDAYRQSGYSAPTVQAASAGAARMLAKASITSAIARAQAATQERTTVDSDRLVGMALKVYESAMDDGAWGAANTAIITLGRLTGSLLDHRSVTVEHRADVRERLVELPLSQLLAIRERLTADVVDVEAVEVDDDLQGNPREAQKL
jgi:hypothetical protein